MTATATPESMVVTMPAKEPIPPGPRFIVTRKPLLDALEMAASVVKARTPKPILLCVHIETDDGALVIRATDLEISIRAIVTQVQIEKTGRCVASAEVLHDVLAKSSAETVKIDATGDSMIVTDDDSKSTLRLNDPLDFPPAPDDGDVAAEVTMPLTALTDTLKRAALFTQKDATRYAFNGILLRLEPSKITIAATDGRRMYADHGPVKSTGTAWAIIPMSAVAKIMKLAGEEISIALSPNRASFSVDDLVISTNLIEGQFPPFEDIVPQDAEKKFSVGREAFATALRKATAFATETTKGARFELSAMGCIITVASPELGSAEVRLPGKYEGFDLAIGANPKFLIDCLTGTSDDVHLHFVAANRPIAVRDSTNAVCVVMPVNLR